MLQSSFQNVWRQTLFQLRSVEPFFSMQIGKQRRRKAIPRTHRVSQDDALRRALKELMLTGEKPSASLAQSQCN
jgi:hypothetical protein